MCGYSGYKCCSVYKCYSGYIYIIAPPVLYCNVDQSHRMYALCFALSLSLSRRVSPYRKLISSRDVLERDISYSGKLEKVVLQIQTCFVFCPIRTCFFSAQSKCVLLFQIERCFFFFPRCFVVVPTRIVFMSPLFLFFNRKVFLFCKFPPLFLCLSARNVCVSPRFWCLPTRKVFISPLYYSVRCPLPFSKGVFSPLYYSVRCPLPFML